MRHPEDFLQGRALWARANAVRVIDTSPQARTRFDEVCWSGPIAILLGEERKGMTREEEALCSQVVGIPMVGRADSLNVGVAAGLLLYQATMARHTRH